MQVRATVAVTETTAGAGAGFIQRARATSGWRRVSSTLNGDTDMYGKMHMFDGTDDSCWNSDQVCASSDRQ